MIIEGHCKGYTTVAAVTYELIVLLSWLLNLTGVLNFLAAWHYHQKAYLTVVALNLGVYL